MNPLEMLSRGNGMRVGRLALLTLIAFVLFRPGVLARDQGTGQHADRLRVPAAALVSSASGRLLSSVPARGANFLPFVPKKLRPKIVLVETDYEIAEEQDLGPADPLGRLIASIPIELAFRSPASRPPLRC
jgi:hypothetical protein